MLSTFSNAYWPFVHLLWRSVYLSPLSIFFFFSWIIWGVLWLSCSCLYTLDINLFSNIELANISSHGKYSFPGYLFALLTVSFDAHIFNFDTVQFIYFHFCWLCFWCHIQEIIVKSDIIKLFLFFLLRVS